VAEVNPDDISGPLDGNPTLSSQPPQQLNLNSLWAARPNPKWDDRAKAAEWNREFAGQPRLQVNLDEYPEAIAERSPEEVEANLNWLWDWGNGIHSPRPF
jgi:hypothetical protein